MTYYEIPLPLLRRYGKQAGVATLERKQLWALLGLFTLCGFVGGVLTGMRMTPDKEDNHVTVQARR